MKMRRLWAIWFAVGVSGFAVLEYAALRYRPDDALSRVIRDVLGLHTGRGRVTRPAFVLAIVVFDSWFVPHILRAGRGSFDLICQPDEAIGGP